MKLLTNDAIQCVSGGVISDSLAVVYQGEGGTQEGTPAGTCTLADATASGTESNPTDLGRIVVTPSATDIYQAAISAPSVQPCVTGIVGGAIAGLGGGAGAVVLGVIGGGIAGGCLSTVQP